MISARFRSLLARPIALAVDGYYSRTFATSAAGKVFFDTDHEYNYHPKQDQADGLKYIVEDHSHLREMFARYKAASDIPSKLALADRITKNITVHASAEERYFYPFVKKLKDGQALYDRAILDDMLLKDMLQYIETHGHNQQDPDSPEWKAFDATVHKLTMICDDHMDVEEGLYINPLEEVLSEKEKADLLNNMQFGKKMGKTHPHPSGPAQGLAAKVTHPVVGGMDRLYDAVRGGVGGQH